MEFYYYSPSETFVVLTADQFVGRDDVLTAKATKSKGWFSLATESESES